MGFSVVKPDHRIELNTVEPIVAVPVYENGIYGQNTQMVELSGKYIYLGARIDDPSMARVADASDPTKEYWIRFNMYSPYDGDDGLTLNSDYETYFEAYKRKYNAQIAENNNFMQEIRENLETLQEINIAGFSGYHDTDGDIIVQVDEYLENASVNLEMEQIIKSYGLPPQWTKYVDPRIYSFDGSEEYSAANISLGRRFLQVTISNPTLIEISPGYVRYCDGVLDAAKNNTEKLKQISLTDDPSVLAEALKGESGFLYTIKPCFANMRYPVGNDARFPGYISYVNCLMSIVSVFLTRASSGQGDQEYYNRQGEVAEKLALKERPVPAYGDSTYKLFEWERYDNSTGKATIDGPFGGEIFTGYVEGNSNGDKSEDPFTYIRFYAVGSTKSTDTFNTSTGPSAIANMINGVTDGIKDFAFIINGMFGSDNGGILNLKSDVENEVNGLLNTLSLGLSGTIQNMFGGMSTILGGGKMLFPDIIEDATYGKSIACECTFTGVYGEMESILLNVMAPYIHILAFVLPHQVRSGIDIYTFPFLVKAFAKGIFNCSMGVLTSFTVSRGGADDEMWSVDKAPVEISVSFEITPMVSKLVMSSTQDGWGWILKNFGLQEYLSSLCGVDLRNNQWNMMAELQHALAGQTVVGYKSNFLSPILNNELMTNIRTTFNKFGNYDFRESVQDIANTFNDVINGMF